MRRSRSHQKTITALTLAVFLLLSFKHHSKEIEQFAGVQVEVPDLKEEALKVLRSKCNTCHKKKNPRRVFTQDNMTGLASRIYKQVFVKKRMPKGTSIRLTDKEYNTLKKWLLTQNMF